MTARDVAIELSVEIASTPIGLRHQTAKRHAELIDAILAAVREQAASEPRPHCKRCDRLSAENQHLKLELARVRAGPGPRTQDPNPISGSK